MYLTMGSRAKQRRAGRRRVQHQQPVAQQPRTAPRDVSLAEVPEGQAVVCIDRLSAGRVVETHPLWTDTHRTVSLGQRGFADLVLDDPGVEPVSAVLLIRADRQPVVRSVGAVRSVVLNGVRVQRALLSDGDQLRIGDSSFAVRLTKRTTTAGACSTEDTDPVAARPLFLDGAQPGDDGAESMWHEETVAEVALDDWDHQVRRSQRVRDARTGEQTGRVGRHKRQNLSGEMTDLLPSTALRSRYGTLYLAGQLKKTRTRGQVVALAALLVLLALWLVPAYLTMRPPEEIVVVDADAPSTQTVGSTAEPSETLSAETNETDGPRRFRATRRSRLGTSAP